MMTHLSTLCSRLNKIHPAALNICIQVILLTTETSVSFQHFSWHFVLKNMNLVNFVKFLLRDHHESLFWLNIHFLIKSLLYCQFGEKKRWSEEEKEIFDVNNESFMFLWHLHTANVSVCVCVCMCVCVCVCVTDSLLFAVFPSIRVNTLHSSSSLLMEMKQK